MSVQFNKTIVAMVKASVEASFDSAVTAFNENATADNYSELENAMLAFQFFRNGSQECCALVDKLPIARWTATIAGHVLDRLDSSKKPNKGM